MKIISKTILAEMYSLSIDKMSHLLNNIFYEDLLNVGYNKNMKILPPIVVRKFIELYGEPISDEDFKQQ